MINRLVPGCGCEIPSSSSSSSSSSVSSSSDDPCNCNDAATYYLKIELSGMVDEVIHRGNRPGQQISCPRCYVVGIYYPAELTGTYFVPIVRQCVGGVPSFAFPTPQTIVLRDGTVKSLGLTAGCGTPLIEWFPGRVSVGILNGRRAIVSVYSGFQGMGNYLHTASSNVIDLPVNMCAAGVEVGDLGATGDIFVNNRPAEGCTPSQDGGPLYADIVGTLTWSIVPGELP